MLRPLLLSAPLFLATSFATESPRPNVILIMADDLGWGDTAYNGHPILQTPHLDQMSKDGLRFHRFYSACAVSSPTRASCLTGRNPYRMGVFNANVGILRPEEITLPELLKEEGYATGHFGKWHLGTLTHSEKDANRGKIGNTKEFNPPKLHGYDTAFVTESKVPTWDPMKKPLNAPKNFWNALKDGEPFAPYGTAYWDIEGNKIDPSDNLEGDDSRVIMDRVIPFIEQQSRKDKNFFAAIWFHAPHLPCVAGPQYAALYKEHSMEKQNYWGCITAMDEQIGRLRAYLKEKGLDQNTLIFFCADNGPENNTPGTTKGLRERKRSLLEGGVRVPGLVVWPAQIKAGQSTNYPAFTSDYLPTIAAAVGIDSSKLKHELDGINILPALQSGTQTREEPIVICYTKQVSHTRSGEGKLYVKNGHQELYHVSSDPEESQSLSLEGSEQKYQEVQDTIARFKNSFEGGEYGTASHTKLQQTWKDPLESSPSNKKKAAKPKK